MKTTETVTRTVNVATVRGGDGYYKTKVPLTDEQKLMCWSRATCNADVEHKTEHQCLMDYGSEIEAAHDIGDKTCTE